MVYAASADEKTRALELLIDSAGEEPMWIVECCRRIAHFGNILRLHEQSHDVWGLAGSGDPGHAPCWR